jgi:hypothetical protein
VTVLTTEVNVNVGAGAQGMAGLDQGAAGADVDHQEWLSCPCAGAQTRRAHSQGPPAIFHGSVQRLGARWPLTSLAVSAVGGRAPIGQGGWGRCSGRQGRRQGPLKPPRDFVSVAFARLAPPHVEEGSNWTTEARRKRQLP